MLAIVLATLLAPVVCLHLPVFTRGALITPAGMQYGQWPFKAYAREVIGKGALLEENSTLSDLLFQVYPWQLYTTRSLQGGWIPLWNPYSYCGVPFVANAQSAVFYPLHWPAWIVPSMRVFTAAILMKMVLAGLFMAWFLRGLGCGTSACALGSVAFALCGFMTAWLGYAHTNAAIMLPLLMHAAGALATRPSTGPFLLLAFAGGVHYLGGHPETSLHIVGASALYFLWCLRESSRPRLAIGLFAAGSLLGFAMAAVQMLPFLEYLRASAALVQRQALAGMDPALPAEAPLTLLLPGYFGSTLDGTWHGPAAYQALASYTGAGVALAALLSLMWWRRSRFFAALAIACAAIVYGPPVARAALKIIPVVGISSNNRLLLVLSFCLATMAALTMQGVTSCAPSEKAGRARALRAGATLLAALPLIGVALAFGGGDPAAARLAAAMIGGTAVLLALAMARPSRQGVYMAGIVGLACVDMFLFAAGYNPHATPEALFPRTKLTDFLRQDAAADMVRGGRVMTIGWSMRPETQLPYWLSSIEGYDAMEFADYRHLADRARLGYVHETGEIPAESRPLIDLLGTRYIVTPPGGVVSGEGMRAAYDGDDGRVFINESARPRISFVTRAARAGADRETMLLELAKGQVDLAAVVLLDDQAPADDADAADTADRPALQLDRATPGALSISVQNHASGGWLVVGDAWAPGWEATVNEQPVPVLRANYLFMAVPVPARHADVMLSYRPLSFRLGVWISLLSLLFAILVGLMGLAAEREPAAGESA